VGPAQETTDPVVGCRRRSAAVSALFFAVDDCSDVFERVVRVFSASSVAVTVDGARYGLPTFVDVAKCRGGGDLLARSECISDVGPVRNVERRRTRAAAPAASPLAAGGNEVRSCAESRVEFCASVDARLLGWGVMTPALEVRPLRGVLWRQLHVLTAPDVRLTRGRGETRV
jgi:hypothetical protein